MAIKRPDIYEHNNPNLAIVDSDFVRGGGRVVANLTELYALANKIDQLKERVTKVYVISEEITYVLVNKSDITGGVFNSTAWEEESGGMSTVYTDGITITGDGSEESPLVAQIPEETDPIFNASQAKNITSTHITVLNNTSGTNTGDQDLSGLVEKIDNHSLVLDTEIAKLATIEEYAEPNDPNTVIDANYVHTDNNYTDMDKTLLSTALQSESDPVYALDKDRLSNTSGTNTGDETTETIKTKLGISVLSGSNTGDQDLSGYATVNHNHNLADLNEKSYNSLSDKPPIPSIVGLMKEVDYTGETGLQQVNYAKSADEAEQAIHAYSAQQDALGREIHTTYALKDSGITPPETETITLTDASPVYTVTNATAPALIVLNNATTDGEIYLSGELGTDKSITIQVFGNDTLISSHSGSNTYQDEDTIFASFEVATASWFVTDTETTIIPDYSDMVVDTMLVDPAITPKPGYVYVAGDVFTINTLVFIKSTSTPTQTGIYKVFSTITGGSNMYLIAAGTALHTVRVKDGEVWYSQYDGKNTSTLIFEKFSNKINKTNDTVDSLALNNVCLVKVEGTWKEISYQNIRNDFYIESDTAPLNPKNGMGWVDITSGIKYNYTLGAWVELSAGANGKSPYEIALDNGFIGTESEWLDFISYGSKELMITKVGLNGDLYPIKYPVDKQRTITGYRLASNASDFSIIYDNITYTKVDIVGLIVMPDTEIILNDLTIIAGHDTGTAILYLQ